ncbi:MAG: hypothetical protein OXI27_08765 [Thaumarchaeota archaeon]|nr:hypothetical protein [Nitrososphaerota archaeon]
MPKSVLIASLIVLLATAAVMALPVSVAESQTHTGTTGVGETGGPVVPGDMLPADDGAVGPVGIVNELYEAHGTITDIMIDHSGHDYSRADDIVFTMTFVDEDEEKLHVILDPILLTLGLDRDEADIAPLLEIGEDRIETRYGIYTPEGHVPPSRQSHIDRWILLYDARCDSPTTNSLCKALYFNLATQNHYVLDGHNRWQTPGTLASEPEPPTPEPVAMPSTLSTTVFSDDFEDGLGNWNNSGRYSWESGRFGGNSNPPGYNGTNNVASADDCDVRCTLTLATPLDLSSENRTSLAFYRYVDHRLDSGEYLGVEVATGNGTWTRLAEWSGSSGDDDNTWHFERLDITQYISDEFQVRFVASMSLPTEVVRIDDVTISRVMEFYGGNNYTIFFTENGREIGYQGTITIGATNGSTGVKGIITAGHNIYLDQATQTFHNHTVGNNYTVFNRNADGLYDIVKVDAAFVPIEDPNVIVGSKVQALNGTVMNVTQGSLSDVSRLSKVNIYGALNNDDGFLLFKNATVHDIYRHNLYSMGVATYDSNEGDSGAPIIHHNSSGTHNLVGIHLGGVCAFESPSEGQPRTINVTSYTRWCDDLNDSYYYKTFSAWENVIKALDVQ